MYKNKVAIPIRGQVKFCTSRVYDMHNYALLRREFTLDYFQQCPPTCPAIVRATVLFLLSVESAFSNDCSREVKIYFYAASGN